MKGFIGDAIDVLQSPIFSATKGRRLLPCDNNSDNLMCILKQIITYLLSVVLLVIIVYVLYKYIMIPSFKMKMRK